MDEGLYEVRLLTVLPAHRGSELAVLLTYAAFRWVESHGGSHLVAIGRREILDFYVRIGLKPARQLVLECRRHGLFLRNAASMGSQLGSHAIRIAVKDAATNARMLRIINAAPGRIAARSGGAGLVD